MKESNGWILALIILNFVGLIWRQGRLENEVVRLSLELKELKEYVGVEEREEAPREENEDLLTCIED